MSLDRVRHWLVVLAVSLPACAKDRPPEDKSGTPAKPPLYEGFLDSATCQAISGWAWDRNQPDRPIKVHVYDGDNWITTLLADQMRPDLLQAHKGDGHHSFVMSVPTSLRDARPHAITVKYQQSGPAVDAQSQDHQLSLALSSHMRPWFFRFAGWLLVWVSALLIFPRSSGVLAWIIFAAFPISVLLAGRSVAIAIAARLGKSWSFGFLIPFALVVGASTIPLVVFEIVLSHLASLPPPPPSAGSERSNTAVMPKEWERREANVPGAHLAYYWQGKLHVENEERFRIVGDFPARRPDVFRIMVIGDSLTYGEGIAEEDTYSRVLERSLSKKYRAEVLNLGQPGFQSEDLLRTLRSQLDRLDPDLVIYGMCLNDFLPSMMGQYVDRPWEVAFPGKLHLLKSTRVAPLLAAKMDGLLRRLGIRLDFFGDILRDFHGYQTRFLADVGAMNDLVVMSGRLPIMAMVLDTWPEEERSWKIVNIAERLMQEGGMTVVPADYRRTKGKEQWSVSPWEAHPNEVANARFAETLLPAVEGRLAFLEKHGHSVAQSAFYEGFHDTATCENISGWAWDRNRPDRPIKVDIFDGDIRVTTLVADQPRPDLVDAHKGNGHHAFATNVPRSLRDGRPHRISIKYNPGGASLDASPRTITCPSR